MIKPAHQTALYFLAILLYSYFCLLPFIGEAGINGDDILHINTISLNYLKNGVNSYDDFIGLARARGFLSFAYQNIFSFFNQDWQFLLLYAVLLHTLNGLIIFIIFKKIIQNHLSFLLALLYLSYPMQYEVVTWISASLFELCFFLSLICLYLSINTKIKLIFKSVLISILIFIGFHLYEVIIVMTPVLLFFEVNKNKSADENSAIHYLTASLPIIIMGIYVFAILGAQQSTLSRELGFTELFHLPYLMNSYRLVFSNLIGWQYLLMIYHNHGVWLNLIYCAAIAGSFYFIYSGQLLNLKIDKKTILGISLFCIFLLIALPIIYLPSLFNKNWMPSRLTLFPWFAFCLLIIACLAIYKNHAIYFVICLVIVFNALVMRNIMLSYIGSSIIDNQIGAKIASCPQVLSGSKVNVSVEGLGKDGYGYYRPFFVGLKNESVRLSATASILQHRPDLQSKYSEQIGFNNIIYLQNTACATKKEDSHSSLLFCFSVDDTVMPPPIKLIYSNCW